MTVVLAPLAFVYDVNGDVIDPETGLPHGATVPDTAKPEHVELLISQGVLGEPEPAPKPPQISEIEAKVGDDPVKARYQLDLELARPQDEQRSTLIKKLQTIVDAGTTPA